MKRPSPIFIGLAVVSAVGLGLEVYAITRASRATADVPAPASEPEPATPEPVIPPVPASPTARPAAEPPVPRTAAEPPGPPLPPGTGSVKAPLFVAPDAETVRRDADEMAFAALHLNEETRAAIRRINDSHAAKVSALRNGAPVNESGRANNDPSTQTRRAALRELLGIADATRFEAAEQAAAKQLHNRYRWQSLHGVPPGTPDRP